MRSLSLPSHLFKLADDIHQLEESLSSGDQQKKLEHSVSFHGGVDKLTQHNASYFTAFSCEMQQETNTSHLPHLIDSADSDVALALHGMYLRQEEVDDEDHELGLAIDDCSATCSIRSAAASMLYENENHEPDEQEKAKQVVESLASLFAFEEILPSKEYQQPNDYHQEESPTSVSNLYEKLEQRKEFLEEQEHQEHEFVMLKAGDRANSLPAKLILKPSLKRADSMASTGNLMKRNVSFGTLKTREFSIALSDHPSCSYGPPISLGWEYQDREALTLEEYENQRKPRRTMEQMVLSYNVRRFLLMKRAGYSKAELLEAMQEVNRVKRERLMTDFLLPVSGSLDETIEKVVHHLKQMFMSPPASESLATWAL